jgi:hypothetical protein
MGVLKNANRERFALLLASGKTQAEAYRIVWPGSRRWKKENAVHSMASQMATKVKQRVKELLEDAAAKASIKKDEIIAILADDLRSGEHIKSSKAGLASELAKMLGLYAPTKSEVAITAPPHDDVALLIKDRLDKIRAKRG